MITIDISTETSAVAGFTTYETNIEFVGRDGFVVATVVVWTTQPISGLDFPAEWTLSDLMENVKLARKCRRILGYHVTRHPRCTERS